MNKYRLLRDLWEIKYLNDPTIDDFFEIATSDPNGVYCEEVIATFETKEEALAELEKYKCSYEKWENYNHTTYELYSVEEIVYDEDGDIEDYNFIKYADIEI